MFPDIGKRCALSPHGIRKKDGLFAAKPCRPTWPGFHRQSLSRGQAAL
jgi:hypothetical protein